MSPHVLPATADPVRLVRVNAACALSYHQGPLFDRQVRAQVERAGAEYEQSLRCVPDDPAGHYNLGIYYHRGGELPRAIDAYEMSLRLDPANLRALVNLSMAQAGLGQREAAENALRRALELEPANAAANYNLGLLLLDLKRSAEAERCFRAALTADPSFAEAAFSLALLLPDVQIDEAIALCSQAAELRPEQARYSYTLADLLRRHGDLQAAATVLRRLLREHPRHLEARALLITVQQELSPERNPGP